jgi:hypothetical protein
MLDNAAGRFFNVRYNMSSFSLVILAVCRQTRSEAGALFYGTNHFEFSIGGEPFLTTASPFNTVRALSQSGISQIKLCSVHVYIVTWLTPVTREEEGVIGWLDEMCKLLRTGGHLQEMEVEVHHFGYPSQHPQQSRLKKFQNVLKPLESLSGLKSATVEGKVTEAYRAKLVRMMQGDATNKQNTETNREKFVAQHENKRRKRTRK